MFRKLIVVLVSAVWLGTACSMPHSREALPNPGIAPVPKPSPVSNPYFQGPSTDTPDLSGGSESSKRQTTPLHNQIPSHSPISKIVFYTGAPNQKQAALTFDDGPDTHFTDEILSILKQNNIKATFFIVGQRAAAHPEMVKRIVAEGHSIGNHSWDHPDFLKLSPSKVRDQVERTETLIQQIVGFRPALFRPPYGAADQEVLREISNLGYKIIDWSVDTRDWAGTPPQTIMEYVRKELKPGGIILEHCAGGLHEDLSNTVQALPQIIDDLRRNGYTFVTVPQLLQLNMNL